MKILELIGNNPKKAIIISVTLWISFIFILLPSFRSINRYFGDNYAIIVAEKIGGGLYYSSTDEIVVFEEPDSILYKRVYTHENCHRNQHYKNRSYDSMIV